MDSSINSRSLYWSCKDDTHLVAAVVRQTLDRWQAEHGCHHQRILFDQPSDATTVGLAIWTVSNKTQVVEVCAALESQRKHNPQTFQLVYLDSTLIERRGLLIESGATFVVDQICDLQRVVIKVVDHLPTNNQGHHPLTSGLTNRLPWGSESGV